MVPCIKCSKGCCRCILLADWISTNFAFHNILHQCEQKQKVRCRICTKKKNRLQWLSVKLDKGEYSPSDLSRAMRSVSSLEWEEALEVWGEPETRHYTNGIDMAVWTLDERISDSDSWPILIGITPQEFEWSVAALKFEANEGTDWVVSSVEPKLFTGPMRYSLTRFTPMLVSSYALTLQETQSR